MTMPPARSSSSSSVLRRTRLAYLLLLKTIATTYGLPHELLPRPAYHSALPKGSEHQDELAGKEPQSQLQRIMRNGVPVDLRMHAPGKRAYRAALATLQVPPGKELRAAGVTYPGRGERHGAASSLGITSALPREPADGEKRGCSVELRWTWTTTWRSRGARPCGKTIRSP